MSEHEIVILPAHRCRRSQKIMKYLRDRGILFQRIPLESLEGQAIAEQYGMRASPGILVDGMSHNPLDLLTSPGCRVDEEAARAVFRFDGMQGKDGT